MNKNWSATIFLRIPPELMELIDNSSSTTYSTGVELHLYGSGDEAIAEISKLLKQVEFEVNDPHMWVSIAENTGFGSTWATYGGFMKYRGNLAVYDLITWMWSMSDLTLKRCLWPEYYEVKYG